MKDETYNDVANYRKRINKSFNFQLWIISGAIAGFLVGQVIYQSRNSDKEQAKRIEYVDGTGVFSGADIYKVDGHDYFNTEKNDMHHLETCKHPSHTE